MTSDLDCRSTIFPEVGAGGFSRVDGTIAFYTRVHALLRPDMVVLDYGAGRGAGIVEDPIPYRRELRRLKGKVAKVIGVDVDEAVELNPGLDKAVVIAPDRPLPLPDASVDLILSDFVFEHIADPPHCASELDRVLRPGGWICARTNYVPLIARSIPERLHQRVLAWAQPGRKIEDVFPAYYRMNDLRTIRRLFPGGRFTHCSYAISAEPAYLPRKVWVWRVALFVDRILPSALQSNLLLFIQKRVIS